MKQVILLLSFFLLAGLTTTQAQADKPSCAKKCAKSCKKGMAKSDAATTTTVADAATKLAATDASIERNVCPYSGTVSYVRTEKHADGSTTRHDVQYDASTKAFVNIAPGTSRSAKPSCSEEQMKKCMKQVKETTKKSST